MHLQYVSDSEFKIRRVKRGKGFSYLDLNKKPIKNAGLISRIKSLVIPPNWKDVLICEKEEGHIQAVGWDEKDRKQYIYHPKWKEHRQQDKFHRMSEFGRALPKIRARTGEDLDREIWDKNKVIALVIEIMDHYNLRIGNDHYRDENGTFGVSNLRKKHLKKVGDHLELHFKAKSGKYRHIEVEDEEIIPLIKECAEIPGYELFKYKAHDGKYHSVDSQDVNEYLKEVSGENFSSKDFRTWNASVAAIEHCATVKEILEKNPKLKFKSTLVKKVATDMGNTPSVCENYYIHPYLLENICKSEGFDADRIPAKYRKMDLEPEEQLALFIIDQAPKIKELEVKK